MSATAETETLGEVLKETHITKACLHGLHVRDQVRAAEEIIVRSPQPQLSNQ